jgi:6-pyruvoyltetrahydropterin/6-carboxytetrahydropterin synthase
LFRTGLNADLTSRHYLPTGSPKEKAEHSHDYRVEVIVSGDVLDSRGYLVDIDLLRSMLSSVLGRYEGRCLNELPDFSSGPPSLENLSRQIHDRLRAGLDGREVSIAVRVWEDREAWASYEGPPG